MAQVMRITLKAYDHKLVDQSAKKIVETAKNSGSEVSGPVPLPTKKEVVTILRAVHKYRYCNTYTEGCRCIIKIRNASRCLHRYQDEKQIIHLKQLSELSLKVLYK